MKKTYLLIASAALLTAACTNDDYVGNTEQANVNGPIAFNMQTSAQVRAASSGEEAATALGNMFIVWGEKNENGGTAATADNLVFKNYKVTYDNTSANTTTSNSNGWEYVGVEPYTDAVVSPVIDAGTKQTIKYWDLSANSYTFTAVSAKQDDLTGSSPKVKITKNQSGTDVYGKGYTIEVKSGASTGNIYYADRKPVAKSTTATTAFASPVTLTFRHFESKMRLAMYETVPGYKVVITAVKFNNQEHKAEDTDKKFGVDGSFIVAGDNTKFTVSYENATSGNENKAKVTVDGSSATATNIELGTKLLETTADDPLKTASNAPTYDKEAGAYTAILPNPSNTTDMTLTVSYDLISEDTGEKIHCADKTAIVPAQYCQWKSNYAYTYIFKISDKSAELYPITFDAVVESDEVGNQETITTVSDPSITTFAVDATGKLVTGKNEYDANNVIYASVVEKTAGATTTSNAVTLTTSNVKLYTVTTADATNYPITEASVAQSLSSTATGTKKITTNEVTINTSGDTDPVIVTEVPAEDGTKRTLSALRWTGTGNTTYAVEYTSAGNKTYKIVKVAN